MNICGPLDKYSKLTGDFTEITEFQTHSPYSVHQNSTSQFDALGLITNLMF